MTSWAQNWQYEYYNKTLSKIILYWLVIGKKLEKNMWNLWISRFIIQTLYGKVFAGQAGGPEFPSLVSTETQMWKCTFLFLEQTVRNKQIKGTLKILQAT